MNAADFASFLSQFAERGLSLVVMPDSTIRVLDRAAKKRYNHAARMRRYRAKKRATKGQQASTSHIQPIYTEAPELHWRDMPGHDEAAKKMNLALFRRKMLDKYNHLHGKPVPEIKAAFAKINAGQKAKSHLAAAKRTAEAKKRRAAIPETTSLQSR